MSDYELESFIIVFVVVVVVLKKQRGRMSVKLVKLQKAIISSEVHPHDVPLTYTDDGWGKGKEPMMLLISLKCVIIFLM